MATITNQLSKVVMESVAVIKMLKRKVGGIEDKINSQSVKVLIA